MNEAEIEHPVGLVENQHLHARQGEPPVVDQIEQAPRRGDEDVDAACQLLPLAPDRDAAEHDRRREFHAGAIGPEAVGDLARQFPCRAQHQGAAGLRRWPLGRGGQALEDRQGKGGGLAGAGLSDAAQIAAAQHRRDRLELDWGGSRIAFGGKRAENRRGKSKIGEMGQNGNGPSGWDADSALTRTQCSGRETTRAIRAVRMSAGDKDGTSFRRVGGSLTQARSHDSN